MPQRNSARTPGHEMPPPLPYALANGSTWGLLCRECRREIVVDPIRVVEGVDDVASFDSATTFARARCKDCGGKMWHHRGFRVRALQHLGGLPRLITADGSSWSRPAWRPAGR